MGEKRRELVSSLPGEGQCTLCGHGVRLETTRWVRTGAAWLNPWWDPGVETYEVCRNCGARLQVH